MSLTPIEDDNDHRKAGESAESAPTGVWGRMHAVGGWVRHRLASLWPGSKDNRVEQQSQTDDTTTANLTTQTGQVAARPALEEPSADRPVARPATPAERADIDTEQRGDSVRVFDPDEPEAYVTSDVWMAVER